MTKNSDSTQFAPAERTSEEVLKQQCDILGNQSLLIEILNAISTAVPKDLKVTLTRLTLSKGKLTVSGLAEDFGAIDTLKGAIEKSALFTGVTIASSSKESGGDRFQFKVVIALSAEEAL